jgi:hypothetical protein
MACDSPTTNTYRTGTNATGTDTTTSGRIIRYEAHAHEGSGRET